MIGEIVIDSKFSIRSDEDGSSIIDGRAAVFNKESKLISEGGKIFIEIINEHALDKALQREDLNVIANRDHSNSKLLARTKSGTLTLHLNSEGLDFSFTVPDTPLGKDTLELVQRGDLYECSFRYTVKPSNIRWFRGDDGILRREVLEIEKIKDVSIVTDGAFSGTDVNTRGLEEFEAQEQADIESERELKINELNEYFDNLNKKFYGQK